jgi:aminoglycoside phosphotransferase (APT) family kinase protein
MSSEIERALQALSGQLVAGGGTVAGLTRLSGGASQETWSFEVRPAGGGPARRLILRRSPGDRVRTSEAIGLDDEARLILKARAAGAPVAPVVHVCSPQDRLGDAFIMGHVEGETIARRILRDDGFAGARRVLAGQCGAALAAIHAVPLEGLPVLPHSDGAAQLARYETIYRDFGAARPVMELAFAWLAANTPPALSPRLVHGDFRNGNLMVGPDGLRAVLDWELAHIGDPREDLGWICVNSWRFGVAGQPVGGFGQRAALLEAYAAAGGPQVSEAELRWFEMLGTLKWGVMCLIMYQGWKAGGADASVERAMIGRRASETEIDLVNLLAQV